MGDKAEDKIKRAKEFIGKLVFELCPEHGCPKISYDLEKGEFCCLYCQLAAKPIQYILLQKVKQIAQTEQANGNQKN